MGILNIRSVYRSVCCIEDIGDVRETYSLERMRKLDITLTWSKPVWLSEHLKMLRGVIETTHQGVASENAEIPLVMNGNWNMYNLIASLTENQGRISVPEFIKSSYEYSLITQYDRQIINSSGTQSHTLTETGKSCREEFINMRKLESLVYKLTGSASGSYMSAIMSPPSDLEVAMGLKKPTTDLPLVQLFGYECVRLHDLLFIYDGSQVFVGYLTHFQRVCEFFLTMSSLVKVLEYIPIRVSYKAFVDQFIKCVLKVSIKYPEYVGEAIKGARNLIVIKQDKKNIMDSMNALITEMGDKKYKNASIFVEFLNDTFRCSRDSVNFSHLYKAVLHPDIDMSGSFMKLGGLLSGTTISLDTEKIFNYSLRKKIFIAAKLGGFDVRLNPLYGDRHLQNQLNKPSVSLESIKSIDASRFDGTRFNKTDRFANPELFIANPSSKSSAPNPGIGMKQIKEFKGILDKGMFTRQQSIVDPKPVNDVETTLRGIAELDGDAAFKRFKKVVALYEKFENKFPGRTPEEISSGDIEKFFDDNPEVQYLVLTEPKLGEKHKELTRMFYMGEQALKAVTIRVERIAKQLTRKQMGVSITKSYQGRKNDIEQMADSMLRVKEGTINLFISFDLSSFSMKYPHQLLRGYGQVLSEITGLDELRRLDLLFKCSRVAHNTRGYKNSLGIVRGAFEGFLNFVWTSSHAVVLEIALEEANLVGAMLTYSDDGLLRLTLSSDMTKQEIQGLARKIQEVYKRHGLEFNFAKTMCSERVWEYLGEICVEGVLLPTYVKEVCSFGNPLDSQDLDLLSTRFTTYISQAGALAKAGCPAQVCEFLCLYQCMSNLVRIYPDIPIEVIRSLLLIPIEAGGLRIPTALELTSISSIPSFSEFLADMTIMESRSPKLVSLISHFITVNLPEKRFAGRSIIMGEYLPSTRERLDGREVRNWLVDKLRDRLGSVVPLSPLTPERIRQLSIVLRSLDNINPRVIQRIVQATPLMENYMDFADNITKGGALRLLTVPERMIALRKDKMNIQRRLQELRKLSTLKNKFTMPDLMKELNQVYFSEFSLAPPRMSTRTCSIICPQSVEPDVVVLFDLTSSLVEANMVGDLAYTEPSLSGFNPTMHNFWSEHVSKSVDMKEQKKFASFCASVLASSPTVSDAMIAIANIFGIGMPNAPPELVDHVLRFRKMKGKGEDIALFGGKLLRARSAIRFSTQLMSWADTNDGVDLTTIPTLLRMEAANYLVNSGIYHRRPNDTVVKVGFLLSGFEAFKNVEMTQSREIDAHSIPEGPPISSRVRDEYLYHLRTMINEIKASRILKELNNYTREEILELSDIATQVWINDLSDWMSRMAIQEFHAGASYPTLMPVVPLSDDSINLEAIKEGIFKTMKYDRKVCRLNSIEYDISSSFTRFMMSYAGYYDILMEAGITLPRVEEIYSLLPDLGELYKDWTMKRSVLEFANLPMAVIDGKDSMPMAATSVKIKAIKHMVEATQAHIFQVGQEKGWDSAKTSEALGLKGASRIDDILDVISVVNPLMRESEHRSISHPYNQTMAEIELLKFKNFVISLWDFMNRVALKGRVHTSNRKYYEQKMSEYGIDLFKMTFLPYDLREMFRKRLEESKRTDRQHVDHIRYLNESMSAPAISRAKSVVIYNLISNTKPKVIGDNNESRNLLTFFYEVILKKCMDKLRVYSPSFREIIAEEAASIGQIKVKLLTPDLEYGSFHATTRYTMSPVECKAAFGCFIQATTHMGGYEFKTNGSLPDKLVLLLGNNMFLPDQTYPSTPELNFNSDKTQSFFCLDTDSIVDVVRITTYISSTRSGYTVAYLSSTKPKPVFTVIGYAHSSGSKMNILPISPSPSFEYLDALPSDDSLLVRDLNNWCTNIITFFGYQLIHSTRVPTPLRKQTDLSLHHEASVFQIARSNQSIADRDLGLAAALLAGVPSFADKVISYLLVRNWLADINTESLVDLQDEFRAAYNKPFTDPNKKLEYRMKILNDIDETISWVKMSRLAPNFESRRQFYELHKTMSEVSFNLDINSKPRLPGIINPYFVVSTHRPAVMNITEVSSLLYITTEVPGLEDI